MAVLGLRFCSRALSSCGKRGPLFIAVRGPLTIVPLSFLRGGLCYCQGTGFILQRGETRGKGEDGSGEAEPVLVEPLDTSCRHQAHRSFCTSPTVLSSPPRGRAGERGTGWWCGRGGHVCEVSQHRHRLCLLSTWHSSASETMK